MHANVLALGPELRDMAREVTRDLNEAYYLTHCVVKRLMSEPEPPPVDVDTARKLLRGAAAELHHHGQYG